jgi:hypothetical protein
MQANVDPSSSRTESPQLDNMAELDSLYFKGDRMYRHNIMRINYTTYDVRRAQDTINPNTNHNNIMLLSASAQDDESLSHQYVYARVLGIYHVNVIYTGPGMLDYRARRMEFLWVRWFENVDEEPVQNGWDRRQLDRLQFPPLNDEGSFDFIDPSHVLRASHVIQAFAFGLRHPDAAGISTSARDISKSARDSKDWCYYYVNRFVIKCLNIPL